MRSDGQPLSIVPQNAATAPTRNRFRRLSVWETPPNCRRFHDNLYQTQLSGCSALPEPRRQSLPHPYSPIRALAFLRISRNRDQASNPHLNKSKSFGMKLISQDFILCLRNMLLKATFPSSYLGLVGATPAAKKKWVFFGTVCYKFMSVKNTSLTQQRSIYSTPFRRTVHAYSPSKHCDHASQKQAQTAKCLANPL